MSLPWAWAASTSLSSSTVLFYKVNMNGGAVTLNYSHYLSQENSILQHQNTTASEL